MRASPRRPTGCRPFARRVKSLLKSLAHLFGREGDERLSGTSKANVDRSRSGSDSLDKKKRKDKSGTVGRALRTVYDDTLREDIPRDFLDLLGKLD